MSDIHNINYLVDPEKFSNRIVVNLSFIESLAEKLFEDEDSKINTRDILDLASLVESIVLNEQLILEDDLVISGKDEFNSRTSATQKFLYSLDKDGVIDPACGDSAGHILYEEGSEIGTPRSDIKIKLVHDSHVIWERVEINDPELEDDEFFTPWEERALKSFDPKYMAAIEKYQLSELPLNYFDRYDEFYFGGEPSPPWLLLTRCHGIPYLSDSFYTLRDVNLQYPTNIGIELYQKLEQLHRRYFQEIRKFLGPTYIRIPSILSIVLQKCNQLEDIPESILSTREQFAKFRNRCTQLELEMRTAKKIKNQYRIIKEIESSYKSIETKFEKQKTRLLNRMFTVVKNIDPIKMFGGLIDEANKYDIEEQGLVQFSGYYDLWKASEDVEQAFPLLDRIFSYRLDKNIVRDFQEFSSFINSKA